MKRGENFNRVAASIMGAGVLSMVLNTGIVLAQVAPPPPDAPSKTPEYVPPPMTPPAPKPQRNQNRSQPAKSEAPARISDRKIDLPGVDVDVLVKRDANGKLIKPALPLPVAALEANPLVDAATREKLKEYMELRRTQFQNVDIDNLDIVQKIDQGAIENLDPANKAALREATTWRKLLRAPGALSEVLANRGLLTPEQAKASQEIGNSYSRAMLKQLGESNPPEGKAQALTRYMYAEQFAEPMYHYRELLLETARDWDKSVKNSKLSDDKKAALLPAKSSIDAASGDDAKIAAVKAALAGLELDDQRRVLRETVRLRVGDLGSDVGGAKAVPIPREDIKDMVEVLKKGEADRKKKQPESTPGGGGK